MMDEKEVVLGLIGDPKQAAQEMRAFHKTSMLLSSRRRPRIIDRYPGEWVALYDNRVCAHAETREAVLAEIDAMGIPRAQTLVRFINDKPRTMILCAA